MSFWKEIAKDFKDVSNHPWTSMLEKYVRENEPMLFRNLGDDLDDFLRVRVNNVVKEYDLSIEAGDSEMDAETEALDALFSFGDEYEEAEDYEIEDVVSAAFGAIVNQAEELDRVERMSLKIGATRQKDGVTQILDKDHQWTTPDKPAATQDQLAEASDQTKQPREEWQRQDDDRGREQSARALEFLKKRKSKCDGKKTESDKDE